MKLMPSMLMGKKALLEEATRAARQAEHYARVLRHKLKESETHLSSLQKHIPENAPRQTAENLCKTMRRLEYYTKKIAKQADTIEKHVQRLDEGVKHGPR